MPSLSPKPAYPIPMETVELSFSGLNASTNFVQVFAKTAPKTSELYGKIQKATKSRHREHNGDTSAQWLFVPDVGGVFTFTLEEYTITSPSLAAFQDDTGGAPSPTAVASTEITLNVGEKLLHKLGTVTDGADLAVFVWGDTVRATSLEVHGIVTPAIVEPTSPAAAAATEDSSVNAAVNALAGETAATILGSISTVYNSLRSAYENHRAHATHHNVADTENTIGGGYTVGSPKAAEESINQLQRTLEGHYKNVGFAPSVTAPHDAHDGTNGPVLSGASSDPASHYAALVSIWMAYSDHIADTTVHNSADGTNTAPSLAGEPLMTLHRRFLEALASQSPSPPAGTNAGVTTLTQLAGFRPE